MSLKKEPLVVVEIDVDYCNLTYGTGACTAVLGTDGVRKCYNMFFGCQDKDNFDPGTLTLRYGFNQSGLPGDTLIYPALRKVSTNPTKINLGGVDDGLGSLGKRGKVEIALQDFADSDIYLDKYQSGRVDGTAQTDEGGYNPADRGTHFGKLRRRFPYYFGRALRVKEGYVGDSLASMPTRHYVITKWSGPDASGGVQITAKDILDLARDDKALCPTPSRGKLLKDISATYTGDVTLTPSSIGDEYSSSGRVSIGSEVMTFTRSGDVLTITERGMDGTEAASHKSDDLVQECFRCEERTIARVARDLMRDYAGIDPSFIPFSDWQSEAIRWLAGFDMTATITKPTGVTKLLGELAQHGVLWWWSERDQEIKMRANRPLDTDETATSISDDKTVLRGTLKSEDKDDQRLTRVIFWHGQLDPSGSVSDGNNYARAYVAIDEDAEQANEYDQTRVYEVFSRWLGDGNDGVAAAVSKRLVNRYRDTPREVSFDADIKDQETFSVADLIEMTSRVLQDDTGNSVATQMQVASVEEVEPSHKLHVVAQTFEYDGRYGFITENGRSDYDASSASEKANGFYIVGGSGEFSDGTSPYLIF